MAARSSLVSHLGTIDSDDVPSAVDPRHQGLGFRNGEAALTRLSSASLREASAGSFSSSSAIAQQPGEPHRPRLLSQRNGALPPLTGVTSSDSHTHTPLRNHNETQPTTQPAHERIQAQVSDVHHMPTPPQRSPLPRSPARSHMTSATANNSSIMSPDGTLSIATAPDSELASASGTAGSGLSPFPPQLRPPMTTNDVTANSSQPMGRPAPFVRRNLTAAGADDDGTGRRSARGSIMEDPDQLTDDHEREADERQRGNEATIRPSQHRQPCRPRDSGQRIGRASGKQAGHAVQSADPVLTGGARGGEGSPRTMRSIRGQSKNTAAHMARAASEDESFFSSNILQSAPAASGLLAFLPHEPSPTASIVNGIVPSAAAEGSDGSRCRVPGDASCGSDRDATPPRESTPVRALRRHSESMEADLSPPLRRNANVPAPLMLPSPPADLNTSPSARPAPPSLAPSMPPSMPPSPQPQSSIASAPPLSPRTPAVSRSSFRLRQSAPMETDEMGNTSVGGLVLWRELGAGASATVYLGLDDDEDSAAPPRAVKVVDRSVSRRQGLGVPLSSPRMRKNSTAFTACTDVSHTSAQVIPGYESLTDPPALKSTGTVGGEDETSTTTGGAITNENNENENETTETLQEVDVLRTLERHPNIVTLHECIDDPDHDQVYLVMDFVPDGPIAKLDPHTGCCAHFLPTMSCATGSSSLRPWRTSMLMASRTEM